MELILILFLISYGLIGIAVITAMMVFNYKIQKMHDRMCVNDLQLVTDIEKYIEENRNTIVEIVVDDGKKTRKESQEIKTRLTQVRKDLNLIDIKVTAREPMPKFVKFEGKGKHVKK